MARARENIGDNDSRFSIFHPRYLALLALLFALIQSTFSSALEVPPLKGRVNDYAGLMPPARAQALEQRLERFESESGHQVAVLTISSLQSEDIEGFSIRVAENWKIGKKGFDNGVILVIAQNDRKLRIEVGYGLEGVLPDAIASRIIREVIVPRFRDNDFAGGIEAGVEAIMKVTSGEPLPEAQRRKPTSTSFPLLVQLMLPLLILAAYLVSVATWQSPRAWSSRGRRRYLGSTGGFFPGGFGGGGDFGGGGGFSGGGGGFGGGGASGSW